MLNQKLLTLSEKEPMPTKEIIAHAFQFISPQWSLQNIIAVNPLKGLEDQDITIALNEYKTFLSVSDWPKKLEIINRETIKWCSVLLDKGHATIAAPVGKQPFLGKFLQLLNDEQGGSFSYNYSNLSADEVIDKCLDQLGILPEKRKLFTKLLVGSMPGWATVFVHGQDWQENTLQKADYLALRLLLCVVHWPDVKVLLDWWHSKPHNHQKNVDNVMDFLKKNETEFHTKFLAELVANKHMKIRTKADVQMVFCIDVRSEPMRQKLELLYQDNNHNLCFETFGFAGFFGVPAHIHNHKMGVDQASCPVLLKPRINLEEKFNNKKTTYIRWLAYKLKRWSARCFQALKYDYLSPLAVVEALGFFAFAMTFKRNIMRLVESPLSVAKNHKQLLQNTDVDVCHIPHTDMVAMAASTLRHMGLVDQFAPVVIFCGHGSLTTNNAYASALDCGACGGRHGGTNALALAKILNDSDVRKALKQQGIDIPSATTFLAAEHNTTTDAIDLLNPDGLNENQRKQLEKAFAQAQQQNLADRSQRFYKKSGVSVNQLQKKSYDWAEPRPEWGLTNNAAFFIGPRSITKNLDLKGRFFLHSYDPTIDNDGKLLTTILTAPVVVAQWINNQYLFSTLDNVAFGGGSKVTKNIVGKSYIMQGNASDLMYGLPLQSVYYDYQNPHHTIQRLQVYVVAKKHMVENILKQHPEIGKLVKNNWIKLHVLEDYC